MQTLREILAETLAEKQRVNPRFSLRAWARQLGYRNPSMLHDIMNGRRSPSKSFVYKFAVNAKLSQSKVEELLNEEPVAMRRLNASPKNRQAQIDLEEFKVIAEWYHLALIEALKLDKVDPRPAALAKKLNPKIPTETARQALLRLCRLGFVKEMLGGSFALEKKSQNFFVGKGEKSDAIMLHHSQMIELAKNALIEQPIQVRDFSGTTIALNKEDLSLVTKEVYKFHRWLTNLSNQRKNHDAIYRLNVQLFKLDEE